MSVDTKGLVHTPVKDVMHVMSIVETTLRKFIKARMPAEKPRFGLPEGFKYPEMQLNSGAQTLSLYFEIAGEKRNLMVNFSCDRDNNDTHPGKKLKFMLGRWGLSAEIMTEIMSKLTHLGPSYVDVNDCDDAPYVEVVAAPMTFIEAVVQNFNSALHVDDWVRAHAALRKTRNKVPLARFLGVTDDELSRFKADRDAIYDICEAYEAAAKKAKSSAPATADV